MEVKILECLSFSFWSQLTDRSGLLIELAWFFRGQPQASLSASSGLGWLGWCVEGDLLVVWTLLRGLVTGAHAPEL